MLKCHGEEKLVSKETQIPGVLRMWNNFVIDNSQKKFLNCFRMNMGSRVDTGAWHAPYCMESIILLIGQQNWYYFVSYRLE